MRKARLYSLFVSICLSCSFQLVALEREVHFDASRLGIGVRAMALGGVYSVLDSPAEGVFSNPAVLSLAPNFQLQSSAFQMAGDTSYKVLSLALPLDGRVWGFGIMSNLTDGFTKTTYLDDRVRPDGSFSAGDLILTSGVGQSFQIFSLSTRLGLAFKYYVEIIDSNQRSALGGDAGLQIDFIDNNELNLSSGLMLRNVWTPRLPASNGYQDIESLASELAIGLGLGWKSTGFKTMADFIGGRMHAGVEVPVDNLDLRAGYGAGDLSLGVGLSLSDVQGFDGNHHTVELNYAYQQFPAPIHQEQTHAFSISYLGLSKKVRIFSKPITTKIESPVEQLQAQTKIEHDQVVLVGLDSEINLDLPEDKMRTDLDYIIVKGSVGKNIRRLFVNKKEVVLGDVNSFRQVVPLIKDGKQLIIVEGIDKDGKQVKKVRRIFHVASFVDIRNKDAEAEAIFRMAELGFISGYKDNSFQPNKPLSRAEFAAIICKIKNFELQHITQVLYRDVDPAFWAAPYIEAVVREGLMKLMPDGLFKPLENLTHSQAIQIIGRFSDVRPPVTVLEQLEAPLTRAEAALWLYRTSEVQGLARDLNSWNSGF